MGEENGGYFVRTVEYKLYPNATEEKKLRRSLRLCGRLYNQMLEMSLADLAEGLPKKSVFDLNDRVKEISDADSELRDELYCTCRRDISSRIHQAMAGCTYDPGTGEYVHKPRFKSVRRYDSLTYNQPIGFKFDGDRLKLSKIGSIRYRHEYHPKGGEMRTCTVARKADGWYATITYRVPRVIRNEEDLEKPSHPEAYDLGLVDLITDTSGEKVRVPDFYAEREEEIKRIQSRMSRREKGSPRWEKERQKLARIHSDIHRKRRGYLHKVSRDMVAGHTKVVLEKLAPKKMKEKSKGRSTRKRYAEASWGTLIGMLEYKAEGAGVQLRFVDPWDTSRTCSGCGNVVADLPLSQRTYRCGECGLVMDRDMNAAINILRKGLGYDDPPPTAVNGRRRRPHRSPTCGRPPAVNSLVT